MKTKRSSPLTRDGMKVSYRAPTCADEETLAAIWESALGVKPIGIDDDFFELGGDSITAMQILNSLDRQHNLKLYSRVFFDYPSISKMVLFIQKSRPDQTHL